MLNKIHFPKENVKYYYDYYEFELELLSNVLVGDALRSENTYYEFFIKNKLFDIKDKEDAKLKILEEVGLKDKINNKIYELSGGEQQRVSISMIFLKPCNIILADEPTGSLDDMNKKIIMKFLEKAHEDEKTITMVTHDREVSKICERIVELN